MKKHKHKWKYQINVKKKVIVLVILGVSLFVGLGYAILETNLGIFGTLQVSKVDRTLYGVFVKNYDDNNHYALKYSGNHQDSMDSSKSTQEIYHWNNGTDPLALAALDKDNVVFADQCWQMYRTTDTGGVRMIYYGEADITDNGDGTVSYSCADNRGNHDGYAGYNTIYLPGTYYYASSYNYDKSTGLYSLDFSNDPIKVYKQWSTAEANNLIGLYTCKSNAENGTCSTLYYIEGVYSNSTAYSLNLGTSTYQHYGNMKFNAATNSPAYQGYMYGDVFKVSSLGIRDSNYFNSSAKVYYDWYYVGDTFYYSDIVDYGNVTPGEYTLDNPIQMSSTTDPSTLPGKFTIRYDTHGTSVFYIIGVSGREMYCAELKNGNLNHYVNVSTAYQDNLNGTYSLDGTVTPIDLTDWWTTPSNATGKYTCGDSSSTCSDMRYIYNASNTSYNYVLASTKLTIAETRTGMTLNNPATIGMDDWYKGYNTTYKDYVYTCGNTDTVCTESNLKYFSERGATYYSYIKNHYYGTSVVYENGVYKLQNTEPLDALLDSRINTHHYTCVDLGEKECASVAYVFYLRNGSIYYLNIDDPTIDNIDDALDAMFNKNTTDSIIKKAVDAWYEKYLMGYEDFIDDTIYCNDRSYDTRNGYRREDTGWYPTSALASGLYFRSYYRDYFRDLDCPREEDSFSYANPKAHLKYKVGLMTIAEVNLLLTSNSVYTDVGAYYRLMSPASVGYDSLPGSTINSNGGKNYTTVSEANGVRPVISLVKGTSYVSGDGSKTNPYVVDAEGPVRVNKWKKTALADTTIDNSSATTTIYNLGTTTNGNDLATIEYYTTCTSGTVTGTKSNPQTANIVDGNHATITINACEGAKLHYRVLDTQGNSSLNWVTVSKISEYLLYGQVYNNLIYPGAMAKNNDENLSAWVNDSTYTIPCDRLSHIAYYDSRSKTVCDGLETSEFVERLYQSLLGRASDSTKATWISKINNNEETKEGVILDFLESSESKAIRTAWGLDSTSCTNP